MTRRLLMVSVGLWLACAGDLRFNDGAGGGSASGTGGGVGSVSLCSQCAATQRCVDDRCVDCVANSECPGGLCDVARGRCMQACNDHDQCAESTWPRGCRDEFGADRCVACREDEHCDGGRVCSGGICGECDSDARCPGGRCDRSRAVCVY